LFKGFVLAVEQVDFVIQRGQHLGYGFLFGEGWEGNIYFIKHWHSKTGHRRANI
jgi:hypothetical protein